jgi:dipeptidyl-peptidase-4
MPFSCFLLIGIVGTVAVPDVRSQTVKEVIPKEAESRLRAIYEREEFRAKRFRADWLDDSSGYTVLESVRGAHEKVLARYDAASGKRTVLDSPPRTVRAFSTPNRGICTCAI